MKRLKTRLDGPILIETTLLRDERGFFVETYRRSTFAELGISEEFVQHNQSRSPRGVVRGLHFQVGAGVSKLARCSRGAVLDVMVDLRRGSPTFGEWEAFELSEENGRLAYCPIGFGHGHVVLTDEADFVYSLSDYYDGELERGIAYDDPDVGVQWPDLELIASKRDATAPRLRDVQEDLPF